MKKILIIITVLVLLIQHNVQASPIDDTKGVTEKDSAQVEQLYDYMSNIKTKYEILKDLDIKSYVIEYIKNGDGNITLKKFSNAIFNYFFKEVVAVMKIMSMLLIICVVCALLTNLQRAFSNEGLSNIAYFACYSMIIIIIARSFYIGVDEATKTMKDMTDLMAALIPVLLMLIASTGGMVQAVVMDPIIIGVINISARIFIDVLVPLILMAFVLQFVNNISSDYKIDQLTKLINQLVMWIQGIVMTIFIGIITIRGISSKAIDEVTAKTAKFAVDNFVPIVGKALSDAISTVAGYSILLKNAISGIGLVFLIIIVIFPIIKLLILALMHKLTAALVEPISDKRIVTCISAAGDSLILIASCLIGVSVMFFIMIAMLTAIGRVV